MRRKWWKCGVEPKKFYNICRWTQIHLYLLCILESPTTMAMMRAYAIYMNFVTSVYSAAVETTRLWVQIFVIDLVEKGHFEADFCDSECDGKAKYDWTSSTLAGRTIKVNEQLSEKKFCIRNPLWCNPRRRCWHNVWMNSIEFHECFYFRKLLFYFPFIHYYASNKTYANRLICIRKSCKFSIKEKFT